MTYATKGTKKELFLEAYKINICNISKACESININRKTFYRWLEKFPKFKEQIEEINEALTDMVECQLYKNVKKGMEKAIEFYLCNRKKDKYSNIVKNELTGAGGGPITYKEYFPALNPENKEEK